MALCGRGGGRSALTSAFVGGGARRPGPERQLGVLRPPAFGLWPEARPRVFPGWQTAPGGREVAVWPCAGAVEAGVSLPVEAPGARAQRGSWASCAPPAFGLWPEAQPRVLAAVVDEQWGGGSAALGLWAPACGQWGPWATSPQRRHGLVTCAIYPCALAGPGQGQGYVGARVRVTFRVRVRWIGTAARSLDPILLHPGKSWILTSRK